jgi:hypothetical protein
MKEDVIENQADLSTGRNGRRWVFSISAICIQLNDPIEEIAAFMCRSRREIREKIAELERSGELPRLIEKAAAEALPETEEPETN